MSMRTLPLTCCFVVASTLAGCQASDGGSYGGGNYGGYPDVPIRVASSSSDAGVVNGPSFTLQLSADDSTSMASAQIAKLGPIANGYASSLHRHEFHNYYDPPLALFEAEPWAVVGSPAPNVALGAEAIDRPPTADAPGELEILLALRAAATETATRRPWNLVFCVDVSGSMYGEKMDFVRGALAAALGRLREGDSISLVTFSNEASLVFDDRSWPADQTTIRAGFESLVADGGTNMIAGLRLAYERARIQHAEGELTRVLVFGDGDANIAETDLETFRAETRSGDAEGIYLTSVGVGLGFDWTRMDQLADAGKGASVFLPNEAEAQRLFGTEQFTKLVEIAADEVSIELELPIGLRLTDFTGEETSTDPERRLPSVVLATGDDLTMLSRFAYDDVAVLESPVTIRVSMRPLGTGELTTFEQTLPNLVALVRTPGAFHGRTELVDAYARLRIQDPAAPTATEIVAAIDAFSPLDPGLVEIRGLIAP